MFGLKFKKREERAEDAEPAAVLSDAEETADGVTEETFALQTVETPDAPSDIALSEEKSLRKQPNKSDSKAKKSDADFARLADILCKDEDDIIEECKLFQIKNIMSRLSKAVVRYGVESAEMKTLVINARKSGLGEIAVSPAYIDGVAKAIEKTGEFKVCAVVDFPFGESSFKVKFSEIKNSVKKGVDGVLTVLNTAALKKDNAKPLKKELKKIGKIKAVETGIAINAEDADSDDIKQVLKLAEKAGVNYSAFLFGNVTEAELSAKLKEIKGFNSRIPVKIMANVENIGGVKTLIALGADGIITPFADAIAKELFGEFKIKRVKLG